MAKNWLSLSVFAGLAAISSVTYVSCTHSPFKREVAAEKNGPLNSTLEGIIKQEAVRNGGNLRITPDMTFQDKADLWHLSEGSEVFPLAWFLNMRSQFSHVQGTKLADQLHDKFNIIPESPSFANASPYPIKYVGLTLAWSGEHPTRSDVVAKPGQSISEFTLLRQLPDGKKSIAMVGVNCAFCHTNVVKMGDREKLFEGAPAMINIRGFFQDMFASTAKTMLTPELLKEFLGNFNVQGDVDKISAEFSASMRKELGLESFKQKAVGSVLNILDSKIFEDKKAQTLRRQFFDRKDVVVKYLVRLLQITYGMDEVPTELKMRMNFLANSIGVDPDLPVTAEGYSRTDAFGRISNLVARTKNPIPLTATTSVPPMWRIEYRAHFHWNANTNSIVMRNIGQSFGLGALLTNPNGAGTEAFDSTSNLHNIHRLESLLYKIRTPLWSEVSNEIDLPRAIEGCTTFQKTCAKCHSANPERVGPQKSLINYRYISQKTIGTDDIYNKNQATPVEGVAFKDALFTFTRQIRNRYYQRYNVSPAAQSEWERREMRGPEIFRDSSLGESGHLPPSEYMNIKSEPTPGYPSRHLAGVWATAPYLHNGSIANLYELLKPAHLRSNIFFVGTSEYDAEHLGFRSDFASLPPIENLEHKAQALLKGDKRLLKRLLNMNTPKPANIWEAKIQVACTEYPERCFNAAAVGNSNKGHEGEMFGTNLSEKEKYELIEFLKILRPEPEYSFNMPALYSWDGNSCQVVQ